MYFCLPCSLLHVSTLQDSVELITAILVDRRESVEIEMAIADIVWRCSGWHLNRKGSSRLEMKHVRLSWYEPWQCF
jgi:hypothetical protein